MPVNFGSLAIANAFLGATTVSAMYLGDTQVYPNVRATGDIQLEVNLTTGNSHTLFSLFKEIQTEEGGFVCVDWGDGTKETFSNSTSYIIEHDYQTSYTTADNYRTIKVTGSKFTKIIGYRDDELNDFSPFLRRIFSFKMPTDSVGVELDGVFAYCEDITSIPVWDDKITHANYVYYKCTGLTGSIPAWGDNIIEAIGCYYSCTGLTGSIPAWGVNIIDASFAYYGCTGLTGSIPIWTDKIIYAEYTYESCAGLTGSIPAWGDNMLSVIQVYYKCTGLESCSEELLEDPMPTRINEYKSPTHYVEGSYCAVFGCVDNITKHFVSPWNGISL